jgi:enoyl-CoA hydratase/carnithine racemase
MRKHPPAFVFCVLSASDRRRGARAAWLERMGRACHRPGMAEGVEVQRSGAVARLRLARPGRRNALDQAAWDALAVAIGALAEDEALRLLFLESATPGVFCAGADIHEFATASADPEWRRLNQSAIRRVQHGLARLPVPTVALIDGDCVGGGCGLAIACDIRLASPRARFGITPARLGLVYSLHDTKLLVDLVGPARARRMLYTGTLMSAPQALAIGLVDEVSDRLDEAAGALEADILAAAPSSQRAIKTVVRRILDGQTDDDAATAALFDGAFGSPDFAEGVAAFREKRPARFAPRP